MDGARRALSDVLDHPVLAIFCDAVLFLLQNKFVKSAWTDGVYQCVRGSGMGLNFSGELSDVVFYYLCEKRWIMRPCVWTKYCILGYWRFKDDALLIFSKRDKHLEFFRALQRCAKPYKVTLEQISSTSVSFLECTATLKQLDNRASLVTSLYTKPTAMKQPLSHTSAHKPSVHFRWPITELMRRRRLSATQSEFTKAKCEFLHQLRAVHFPVSYIDALDCNDDALWNPRRPKRHDCIWLVLDFHPVLAKARFANICKSFFDTAFTHLYISCANVDPPTILISWRNPTAPMWQHLRRLTT